MFDYFRNLNLNMDGCHEENVLAWCQFYKTFFFITYASHKEALAFGHSDPFSAKSNICNKVFAYN